MYQLVLILHALMVPCQSATAPIVLPATASYPNVAIVHVEQSCWGRMAPRTIPLATFPTYEECMEVVAAIDETRRERGICRKVRP